MDSIGQKYEYYSTNLVSSDIPMSHVKFFNGQHNYYVDENHRLFIHGGFNRHLSLREQSIPNIYYWDRDLWLGAMSAESAEVKYKIADDYKHIYIGHTTTMMFEVMGNRNANGDNTGIVQCCGQLCIVTGNEYFVLREAMKMGDCDEYMVVSRSNYRGGGAAFDSIEWQRVS